MNAHKAYFGGELPAFAAMLEKVKLEPDARRSTPKGEALFAALTRFTHGAELDLENVLIEPTIIDGKEVASRDPHIIKAGAAFTGVKVKKSRGPNDLVNLVAEKATAVRISFPGRMNNMGSNTTFDGVFCITFARRPHSQDWYPVGIDTIFGPDKQPGPMLVPPLFWPLPDEK